MLCSESKFGFDFSQKNHPKPDFGLVSKQKWRTKPKSKPKTTKGFLHIWTKKTEFFHEGRMGKVRSTCPTRVKNEVFWVKCWQKSRLRHEEEENFFLSCLFRKTPEWKNPLFAVQWKNSLVERSYAVKKPILYGRFFHQLKNSTGFFTGSRFFHS